MTNLVQVSERFFPRLKETELMRYMHTLQKKLGDRGWDPMGVTQIPPSVCKKVLRSRIWLTLFLHTKTFSTSSFHLNMSHTHITYFSNVIISLKNVTLPNPSTKR